MRVNILTGVLSVATIGFAGASGYFHHRLGVARDQLAAETQLRVDAEAAAQKARQARGALEKDWEQFAGIPATERAALLANFRAGKSGSVPLSVVADNRLASATISASGLVTESSADKKSEPAKAAATNGMVDITGELMKSADGAAALRGMQRNTVLTMYGDLLKELQLSPETADKLVDILTENQAKGMEVSRNDAGQTMIKNRMMSDSMRETEQKISALLSQDKYSQYQDYQRNMAEHMSISQLRSQLATMGRSLPTEAQERRLYAAMVQEKAISPRPTLQSSRSIEEFRELNTQWTDDYERRVRDKAEQILTPEQFAAFRDRQEQQARMRRALPPVQINQAPITATK